APGCSSRRRSFEISADLAHPYAKTYGRTTGADAPRPSARPRIYALIEDATLNEAPTTMLLLALLALLVIIAFSSGTEVAMLSLNRYRIRHRAQSGQSRARVLERLLLKPDDWLGANLVILAAASVFASATATIVAQRTG